MDIRERLLQTLGAAKGGSVSGGQLAKELGVSRTAIWKAVEKLRGEGYEISAATNGGYCLSPLCDVLSKEGIESCLRVPAKVIMLDSADSTNLVAKQMAAQGAPHLTAVLARTQEGGRGRLNRGFYSHPGCGIYLSVVLRPGLSSDVCLLLTAGAGVAVCRAVEECTGKVCGIKWVNDVYLGGKKVCGILTEGVTDFESGNIEYAVVGMGLNVFPPPQGFPKELAEIATAIAEPGSVRRNLLAARMIEGIAALDPTRPETFLEEYRARSVVLGKKIRVFHYADSYPATALDITDRGGLIVVDEAGVSRELNTGEITVRRIEA